MNKYTVNYKGKTRHYRGNTAFEALEKFERQNKVVVTVEIIDADTRGERVVAGYAHIDELGAAFIEYVEMAICD